MHHRLNFAARRCCAAGLCLVAAAAQGAEEVWDHRIERGDTLIGLRDRLLRPGADWRELQRLNRIANPRRLVPGSTLQIPLSMLREQRLEVEVLHAHGTVTLQRQGAPAQPLASGTKLVVGDVVTTGPQSSASLRFADGARVLLRPDSVLRIEGTVRLGNSPAVTTRLQLESGSVDSRVPKLQTPRFEIRTPVANLGVRGTEFRTRASPGQTALEVLDGRVATSGSARGVVDAGFGTLVGGPGAGAPTPLSAAPGLDAVPARVERLPLRLPWKAASASSQFRAQVFAADAPENLLLDGLFGAEGARWSDDLPDGRYELRVRAVDSRGLEGRDAIAAFTLKARPEPPFATQPRAGERRLRGSVTFGWTASASAARYRLQLADNAEFTSPWFDRGDIGGTELVADLPLGAHFWRLASVRADGDQGPWGDGLSLIGVELPPPPDIQPAEITEAGVLMRWRERPGARYQVQVAGDAAFAELLHDEQVDRPQWLLPKPSPGRYFVRVRTTDADGFVGPYGEPQQVEVPYSRWWWLLLLLPLVALP